MNSLRFNEARATLRLVRIAMLLQNMAVRSFSEDCYLLWLRRYFVFSCPSFSRFFVCIALRYYSYVHYSSRSLLPNSI